MKLFRRSKTSRDVLGLLCCLLFLLGFAVQNSVANLTAARADQGAAGPEFILREKTDNAGFEWKLLAQPGDKCIEVHAESKNGDPLGALGICHMEEVEFQPSRLNSKSGEPEIHYGIGRVQFQDAKAANRLFTVVYGAASCECLVKVKLRGGSTLTDRSVNGAFLVISEETLSIESLEAVDGSGRSLVELNIPSEVSELISEPPSSHH